jgi:cellobiose phosphorylase
MKEELKAGLMRFAVKTDNARHRIVHGWGDGMSYFVGSFRDSDGLARDGLTSNAFWVLSGMLDADRSFKSDILAAFDRLDSQYGLKTFAPGFAPNAPGVGRITKLPLGSAENGAVYIHATTFAIAALFRMGEPRRAWEQIIRILPFSLHHRDPSHSPFVMPNSYVDNPDLNLTGQSMNDWQTACSNVLLKLLIRYVFGYDPGLDHVRIAPASWRPFESHALEATAQGRRLRLTCAYGNVRERTIQVNGNDYKPLTWDENLGATVASIPYSALSETRINEIVVIDPSER